MVVSGKLRGLKVVQLSRSFEALAVQASFAIKEHSFFMVLKGVTPISQSLLAKIIMKNTQHEGEQPLNKSHFGLTFKGAESKQLPWTSAEQCGFAAFWDPPAQCCFFCH